MINSQSLETANSSDVFNIIFLYHLRIEEGGGGNAKISD